MQVALGDQVLQQVDQGGAGVGTRVEVDHVVGAAELKERLQLQQEQRTRDGNVHAWFTPRQTSAAVSETVPRWSKYQIYVWPKR